MSRIPNFTQTRLPHRSSHITGSAFALHCCKAHWKIVTPKNFILKLCTRDYVCEVTRNAHFDFNRYSGGFSPNTRNVATLWLFFDCPVLSCPVLSCPVLSLPFFSILRTGRTAGPIFTLYGSNDVFSRKDGPFWGLERWVTIFGGNMPPKLPKNGLDFYIKI